MKKVLFTAAVLGLAALLLAGCTGWGLVVGKGDIISKQFDFKDFNAIQAGSAIEVQVNQADTYGVTISTYENIFDHLDVTQSGKTLDIHLKSGSFGRTDIKAVITMPELASFDLSGASKGNVQGFKATNDLTLKVSGASQLTLNKEAGKTTADVSGASKVTGQLKAQNTKFTVSGASHFELSGSATDVTYNISGASQAVTRDFQIQNAEVTVSGASKATVNASGTISVDATGASTLEYFGNPNLKTVNVSGASKLSHR